MTDEKEFIKDYNITEDNIVEVFNIFKNKYNFLIDGEEYLNVFILPLTITDFKYALEEDLENPLCLALTKEEYFDFILEKIQFLPDLNGITSLN